ncbi:MAG: thioredoxin family protein [bacterium]|nr:thioredoxin family protein [bacterium]
MNTKRMRYSGMILAALLLSGMVVAAVTAAPEKKAANANDAKAKLAAKLTAVLKDLVIAEKAAKIDDKAGALRAIARAKASLTGIRDSVKPPAPVAAIKGWTEDVDKAMKYAAASKRPILLDFTGSDWCGWCIRLHKEIFVKAAFKAYADENLVLVELDFPHGKKQSAAVRKRNRALMQKYGVRGFPTIVILDSTGTKELGRTGYVRGGPEAFISVVKKIVNK